MKNGQLGNYPNLALFLWDSLYEFHSYLEMHQILVNTYCTHTEKKKSQDEYCMWVLLKDFFVSMSIQRKWNADALTTTQLLPMLMSCPHVNNFCSKLITQWWGVCG